MELINGILQAEDDGLILEIMAKYPPYYKSSDRAKWPRINGRLGVGGSGSGSSSMTFSDFTSSFTGTNRNVIDANGLMKTLPASVVAIDHVGASLEPALRLEPAAANILLEVLTDWTDTTLTPVKDAVSWAGAANGAYTVTASGANGTLMSSAVSATSAAFTFVCAMKRKTGTGAVSMTIDNGSTWTVKTLTTSFQYFNVTKTAANPQLGFKLATSGDAIIVDCLTLIPNTAIASSYFAPAAAIGAELVTDGGFDAVTATNNHTSDFSAGVDGWVAVRGTAAGNIDTIGGEDNWLRHTLSVENGGHYLALTGLTIPSGSCWRIRAKLYLPSGQSNVDGLRVSFDNTDYVTAVLTTTDSVITVDAYINATAARTYLSVQAYDGVATSFQDAGGDDVFYIKDVIIDAVTFTNWTAGTGWAPQATAGSLTGKAQKIAGTASNLTQVGVVAANKVYRDSVVISGISGTGAALMFQFGSSGGTAGSIQANGTWYQYGTSIGALNTALILFANEAVNATIDDVSVKEHGTVRLSEANTITLAIPAAVAAMLADTGTIVIKGRFAFPRAAGVVTAILSSQDATASLAYTTTAAGNLSSFDETTVAENTGAYTANIDWKIAITFPSSAGKYRIGVDANGAGIVQGAEVNFDGNFTTTANLILGRVLHGATHIKYIEIFDNVLTNPQINAIK